MCLAGTVADTHIIYSASLGRSFRREDTLCFASLCRIFHREDTLFSASQCRIFRRGGGGRRRRRQCERWRGAEEHQGRVGRERGQVERETQAKTCLQKRQTRSPAVGGHRKESNYVVLMNDSFNQESNYLITLFTSLDPLI